MLDKEDWGKYQSYRKGDVECLARKENEDCIYFDGKCTIYENRPLTCRRFDCRDWINHPSTPQRIKFAALRLCR